MRMEASEGEVRIREVPWHVWLIGAVVLAGDAAYLRALLAGDPAIDASVPVGVHLAVQAVLAGLGVLLLLQPALTTTLDGTRREVRHGRHHPLFRVRRTVPYAEIAKVAVEHSPDSEGPPGAGATRLRLRLTSGRHLPVTVWHNDRAPLERAAELLRRRLGH